jgi:putative transposase
MTPTDPAGAVRPTWQARLSPASARMPRKSRALPPSPLRRIISSPEVIRLVVVMYIRFPLSLRNVEDLLFERGIDICHETVRMWWNRFGPLFAGDIRRQRVSRMRGFRHWRWHLGEMYVTRRAAKPT